VCWAVNIYLEWFHRDSSFVLLLHHFNQNSTTINYCSLSLSLSLSAVTLNRLEQRPSSESSAGMQELLIYEIQSKIKQTIMSQCDSKCICCLCVMLFIWNACKSGLGNYWPQMTSIKMYCRVMSKILRAFTITVYNLQLSVCQAQAYWL